jgi:hypothetical protein
VKPITLKTRALDRRPLKWCIKALRFVEFSRLTDLTEKCGKQGSADEPPKSKASTPRVLLRRLRLEILQFGELFLPVRRSGLGRVGRDFFSRLAATAKDDRAQY